MQDIQRLTTDLRQKAYDYGHEVASAIGIQPNEMPASMFAMLFNKFTFALELLSYYYKTWTSQTTTNASSVEEAKQENHERIVMLQRMVFTETVSSVEYCFKDYVAMHPDKIGRFTGRIYLRNIMKRSKDHKLISDSDFSLWEGIIELRNALVHNNAVSEKSKSYSFPQCILVLEKGKGISGNLKLLPQITDWLLDSSKSWIIEIHKR